MAAELVCGGLCSTSEEIIAEAEKLLASKSSVSFQFHLKSSMSFCSILTTVKILAQKAFKDQGRRRQNGSLAFDQI